ncbi:MAG TPA: hypothetical protein PKH94_08965 [Bacteroidales bacterium]|nr:hypothetical protein [Bacteroidales bacterium]HNS47355.1 hypothetical protein [Bacteroidales bacterium]
MYRRPFLTCIALLLALLLGSNTGSSQSLTGKWWGLLTLPQIELRIVIQIDTDSTGYQAQLFSPD